MDREIVVGGAMLALLIVAAISVALIGREPPRLPRRRATRAVAPASLGRPRARSLFASSREQRLWLWALAAAGAIYSTLGPAPQLAAFLRERNLLRVAAAGVSLLAVGALAWQWVQRRPNPREIGVALGIAAV